ncbi:MULTISPECIES: LysR family transcriptional regulator [unclassified Roseitalea]|uniref:LysR family transcriptional regulator n=1 Tax=unclassified Roseitalea TaxID=2639107 RepID=UPI00273DE709|nr:MULTISPECIES: LysR family transcriptional regulator [unclassified Roseitalea]
MLALADYRCAIAIADERHFRRAAHRLGVTQPALTARLRRIEEVMGARLFNRGRGGVEPTAAGLAFLEGARRVLDAAEETADAVRGARDGLGQTLRIGMTQVAAYQVVGPTMAAFRLANPLARVRLTEGTTAALEGRLEQRHIDVAFIHPPLHSSDLSEKKLAEAPMARFCLGNEPDRPLIRFPKAEAPVLMGGLARDEGSAPGTLELLAEADTILGAAILSEAGYGPFPAPADFALRSLDSNTPAVPLRQTFETCIAWRTLDRRPIIRALVDAAQSAGVAPTR